MKRLTIAPTLALLWILGATPLVGFAQYGLIGAPEPLDFSSLQPLPPVTQPVYGARAQGPAPGLLPASDTASVQPVWNASDGTAVQQQPIGPPANGAVPVAGQPVGANSPVAWTALIGPKRGKRQRDNRPTGEQESPQPTPQLAQPQPAQAEPNLVDEMLSAAPDASDPGYVQQGWPEGSPSERCSAAWADYGAPRWGARTWLGRVMADCGDEECCAPLAATGCCQPLWYVRGLGLVMGRDYGNRVWVSYETGNNANQLMNTQDTGQQWEGGGEIRFGRYFCCNRWAVEAAYWTLDNFEGFASQTHASGVSTPLSFFDVVYQNGAIAGDPVDLFDGAEAHRLWRENEVHNVELNIIRLADADPCGGPFSCDWFVGVRFFRFTEDLTFGSLRQGATGWGVDPADEGYLADRVENNLIGSQVGCRLHYRLLPRWIFTISPAVGIYGNYIEHRFNAYRGDGELFDTAPASYPGYPVSSDEGAISFLSQVDLGIRWLISERWTTEIGYRVIAATGIALADHQIPPFVVDTPELADIDHNGHLVLHGAYVGVSAQF